MHREWNHLPGNRNTKDRENRHTADNTETYTGQTETEFKHKYANHKQSFNIKTKELHRTNQTYMDPQRKEDQIPNRLKNNIKIKIIQQYLQTMYNLCLQVKSFIIFYPEISTLNQRTGLLYQLQTFH